VSSPRETKVEEELTQLDWLGAAIASLGTMFCCLVAINELIGKVLLKAVGMPSGPGGILQLLPELLGSHLAPLAHSSIRGAHHRADLSYDSSVRRSHFSVAFIVGPCPSLSSSSAAEALTANGRSCASGMKPSCTPRLTMESNGWK
jgi:hypothetical protein